MIFAFGKGKLAMISPSVFGIVIFGSAGFQPASTQGGRERFSLISLSDILAIFSLSWESRAISIKNLLFIAQNLPFVA